MIAADTATGVVPDPGEGVHGTVAPYEDVVPYSNLHSLTSPPLGFTSAHKLAVDCVTDTVHVRIVGGAT